MQDLEKGKVIVTRHAIAAAFFFQAEDGIRDPLVTGVQTCALPISRTSPPRPSRSNPRRPPTLRPRTAQTPPRSPPPRATSISTRFSPSVQNPTRYRPESPSSRRRSRLPAPADQGRGPGGTGRFPRRARSPRRAHPLRDRGAHPELRRLWSQGAAVAAAAFRGREREARFRRGETRSWRLHLPTPLLLRTGSRTPGVQQDAQAYGAGRTRAERALHLRA